MPVFKFDLRAVNADKASSSIEQVTKAAGQAEKAVEAIGAASSKAGSQASALGRQGKQAGSDISAAMKNAAKNILALVGAYKAVDAAMSFAKRGVEINASWEQSKIGIASVIASVNQLEDAQGNLLGGADAYQGALGLAEQAMNRIKIMGLETTATTEDLVAGFQQLIGPAAAAGLSMEQTLQFTTSMVKSLGVIGIPFNQLSAEARSLLDGTIVPTQDRLATTLGITGDMVRNWKEQGILAQKLFEKMSAFAAAGDDVARAWSGVTSNLQDAVDMVVSVTGKGMYGDLKESLLTIQRTLVSTEEGASGISADFKNIADALALVQDRLGSAILSGVKEITGWAKELNASIGDTGAVVYLDDLTTALKAAAAAMIALGIARKAGLSDVQISAPFEAAIKSVNGYKAALVEAAQAELNEAKTAQSQFAAYLKTGEAQRYAARSTSNLTRLRQTQAEVDARVIAAEKGLAVALNTSAAAATRAGLAQKALTGIKKALSGVVGIFGGPWGIALTAATAAVTYFMSRQDEAARATEYHEKALKSFEAATKGATDETGKLTGKLTALQKLRLEMAQKEAQRSFESQITAIEKEFQKVKRASNDAWSMFSTTSLKDVVPKELSDNLDTLPLLLRKNIITADEFQERLAELRQRAVDAGYEGSKFVRVLDEMQQKDGLADKLAAIAKTLLGINDASRAAAGGVRVVTDAAAAANAKIAEVLRKSSGENLSAEKTVEKALQEAKSTKAGKTDTLKERQQRNQDARKKLESFLATATDSKQIAQAQKALTLLQTAYSGLGESISSGASKVENAREKFAAFKREISQLSGASSKSDTSLEKKLAEIRQTGKAAGASAQEIEKMQNAYSQAFQGNALNELNKQLLEAENNTEALQKVLNAEKLRDFAKQVNELNTLSASEKKSMIGRYGTALENKRQIKDLQTLSGFYKDLQQYYGDYNLGLENTNRLLTLQAQAYHLAGAGAQELHAWMEMQRLEAARDPWSGMSRSVRKFYADATNYAKGFEEVSTQALTGFSSQLTSTLWKGEQDFAAFFDSIGQMLMDMAIKASMAQAVNGLVGMIGGLFSNSITLPGFTSKDLAGSSWGGARLELARGGVVSGGNLSDYSNSIVTQPTFFGYDRHFSAFARGAGLMGEAGPEAVVPLAHMSDGSLGFNVKGLHELMRQDREWDMRKHSAGYSEEMRRLIAQAAEMRSQRLAAMPTVNVTVINQAGAEVETSQRQNSDGSLELEIMVTRAVARDMSRRGGSTNRVMRDEYNLSKRPIGR